MINDEDSVVGVVLRRFIEFTIKSPSFTVADLLEF